MSKTPDHPAWIPNSNTAGRYGMSNDASRSNNGAFSYRHARQQNAAASEEVSATSEELASQAEQLQATIAALN